MPDEHRLKLKYLHGGVVQYRPGETLGPRRLPDFEMVLIIEGNVTYHAQGRTYAVPPGSMILARPGFEETYRWDPKKPTRHAFFHFDVEQFPDDWPDASSWPPIRSQPEPVLPELFRHVLRRIYMHSNWPARSPGREDCRAVETLLGIFLEERVSEPTRFERERPVAVGRVIVFLRRRLDEDPGRPVQLSELAQVAGVNQKHLCRLFRKTLGHGPVETHRLLCLQLSLSLLARSNLTIKQVAHRCGFGDPGYFSRCFTKTFGRSPRELRRQLNEGLLPPRAPLPADISPRLFW